MTDTYPVRYSNTTWHQNSHLNKNKQYSMSTLTKNTRWVNEPVTDDFSASSNQRATLTVKCACTCMHLYGLYYLVKVKGRATLTFIWNINVDSCKRSFWKKALHIPKHLPHWMVNQPANGDSISRDKKNSTSIYRIRGGYH